MPLVDCWTNGIAKEDGMYFKEIDDTCQVFYNFYHVHWAEQLQSVQRKLLF